MDIRLWKYRSKRNLWDSIRKVFVEYPNYEEEYKVADTTTRVESVVVNEILSGDEIKSIDVVLLVHPAGISENQINVDVIEAKRVFS